MTDQVELWNGSPKIESVEIEWWDESISGEAILELLSPLTSNVVGNDHISDPCIDMICKGRRHGVVDVDIPGPGVSSVKSTSSK